MAEEKLVDKDVPLPGGGVFQLKDIPESMLNDPDTLRRIVELSQQQGQESANVAQFMSSPVLATAARSGIDMPGRPASAGSGPPRRMTDEEKLIAARESAQAEQEAAPAQGNPPLFSRERISGAWDEATGQVKETFGTAAHGAGPNAAAAGLGFAVGGPVGAAVGVGALRASDLLISGARSLLGANVATPSEAARALLDATGVEAGESEVMQLFQNMVESATGTAIGVAGMQDLANKILAANPLAGGKLLGILQTLIANPASQVMGAAGSEIGMAGANQIANRIDERREEQGLPPSQWSRAGLNLAGGMLGDMTFGMPGNMIDTGVPTVPTQNTIRTAQENLRLSGGTPGQARAAIAAADDLGVPIQRSDVFPPQTARERRWQSTLEDAPFGTGPARKAQQIARLDAITNVMSDFGVDTANLRKNLTPELADSFIEPRQNAWTSYTTKKAEALDTVPTNTPVDTSNTITYIDDQIARLEALGGVNADPNTATSTAITEGDVAQTNAYAPLISNLKTWRAALQNNTLDGLETNRAEFGNSFIPEGGYGQIRSPLTREIVSGVYDNIRTDITETVRRYGGDEAAKDLVDANDNLTNMIGDLRREVVDKFVQRVDEAGKGVDIDPNTPLDRFSEEGYAQARMMIEQSPEMITELALHGTPSQINTILPYLDPRGEDLMVATILQETVRDAAPNIRNVSPDRVADNLDGVIQAVDNASETLSVRGIELSPERMQRLEGLRNVLDYSRGPEATLSKPSPANPTQMLSGIPAAQYGAARRMAQNPEFSLPAWFAAVGTAGAVSKIYESPAMRDLLLEAATEGLPATRMQQIVRDMMRVVSSESFNSDGAPPPEIDYSDVQGAVPRAAERGANFINSLNPTGKPAYNVVHPWQEESR